MSLLFFIIIGNCVMAGEECRGFAWPVIFRRQSKIIHCTLAAKRLYCLTVLGERAALAGC